MLEELAKFPNDHIVRHITSWHHNHKFYILYPKAACNLRTYINTTDRPNLSSTNVLWFLGQLRGLADAVRHIHQLGGGLEEREARAKLAPPKQKRRKSRHKQQTGYHHDIKPENILVFERIPGRDPLMKISDFGAGKFYSLRSGESNSKPSAQEDSSKSTLTYAGPESRNGSKLVSRPFDMWALGCVWLELMIWLFMPRSVTDDEDGFATERLNGSQSETNTTDDAFWCWQNGPHAGPHARRQVLNPAVEKRLSQLEGHFCRNKTAFVRVLQLTRQLFEIDTLKRPSANNLFNDIDAVFKQAKVHLHEDSAYYSREISQGHGENHKRLPEIAVPSVAQIPSVSGSPSRDELSEESQQEDNSVEDSKRQLREEGITGVGTDLQCIADMTTTGNEGEIEHSPDPLAASQALNSAMQSQGSNGISSSVSKQITSLSLEKLFPEDTKDNDNGLPAS
jgi:serine/threonine protein kinase